MFDVLFGLCNRIDIEEFKKIIERFETYNLSWNGALYGACIGGTYETEQERNIRMEIVKIIIEKGTQYGYKLDYKHGLYNACRSCHTDIVKLLMKKGSLKGIELNCGLNGACANYEIIYEKGYLDIIKLLIENGAIFKKSYDIYCDEFYNEYKHKQLLLFTKLHDDLIHRNILTKS